MPMRLQQPNSMKQTANSGSDVSATSVRACSGAGGEGVFVVRFMSLVCSQCVNTAVVRLSRHGQRSGRYHGECRRERVVTAFKGYARNAVRRGIYVEVDSEGFVLVPHGVRAVLDGRQVSEMPMPERRGTAEGMCKQTVCNRMSQTRMNGMSLVCARVVGRTTAKQRVVRACKRTQQNDAAKTATAGGRQPNARQTPERGEGVRRNFTPVKPKWADVPEPRAVFAAYNQHGG